MNPPFKRRLNFLQEKTYKTYDNYDTIKIEELDFSPPAASANAINQVETSLL